VRSPADRAGEAVLRYETMNQVRIPPRTWHYLPGQRRVRRLPTLAYDFPVAEAIRTVDQSAMFSGSTDRYNWKLLGKKPMYVPYNAYHMHSPSVRYADLLTPGHLNSTYARYELHRVWVIDATLKPGKRHRYARRVLYLDEDSWSILLADLYDKDGKLCCVSEGHVINFYALPGMDYAAEVHYDLRTGRYNALGLTNEDQPFNFEVTLQPRNFTPSSLRRLGRR
jgi:hypothetical protein